MNVIPFYNPKSFTPARVGHALYVAFLNEIWTGNIKASGVGETKLCGNLDTTVTVLGDNEIIDMSLFRLCGLLWNCRDTLPAEECYALGLPSGSTYAQAARKLRQG